MDQYYQNRDEYIDFDEIHFEQIFQQVKTTSKPIERHTNTVFFDQKKFFVYDKTFIPRWETEGIIKITEQFLNQDQFDNNHSLKYIDICAGTGVIGITLLLRFASFFDKNSKLLDICPHAVENIKKNLQKHNLNNEVVCEDWFKYLMSEKYEFITANFPYICKDESYDSNILKYDPKNALFAADNGWEHYEKLLIFAKTNQFWKLIILECNEFHENKWLEIKKMYEKKGVSVNLYKDFNNKFRFVSILQN